MIDKLKSIEESIDRVLMNVSIFSIEDSVLAGLNQAKKDVVSLISDLGQPSPVKEPLKTPTLDWGRIERSFPNAYKRFVSSLSVHGEGVTPSVAMESFSILVVNGLELNLTTVDSVYSSFTQLERKLREQTAAQLKNEAASCGDKANYLESLHGELYKGWHDNTREFCSPIRTRYDYPSPTLVPTETEKQVDSPDYYNRYSVEVIEMARRIYGNEAVNNFLEISAFKYRMRAGFKSDLAIDIAKEARCLKYMKEFSEE